MSEKLILMAGLPRSGKTTRAREMGFPIVNPDSIRLALHGQRFYGPAEPWVWATAYLMVDALFRAGHDTVVVDATNGTFKRRSEWFDRFHKPEMGMTVELCVIPTGPVTCVERAIAENDEAIIPAIERMAREWDMPKPWLNTEEIIDRG